MFPVQFRSHRIKFSISTVMVLTAIVGVAVTLCINIDSRYRPDILWLGGAAVALIFPLIFAWLVAAFCSRISLDSLPLRFCTIVAFGVVCFVSLGIFVNCISHIELLFSAQFLDLIRPLRYL